MADPIVARVLLTNDDGIDAPGMAVLEAVAAELAGEVWVVAPDGDRSGASHALTLHRGLRVQRRGARRFAVAGTPGDCAAIGIGHLMAGGRPDLILSGVNRGMNLGIETAFSGTVGGAMTGMMLGVPAIAISQQVGRDAPPRWDTSRAVLPGLIRQLVGLEWGLATCLNVNIPDLPADRLGPPALTRQGPGLVDTVLVDTVLVEPAAGAGDAEEVCLTFRRSVREQPADSDAAALRAGRVSITPIRYDRTDDAAFRALAARMGAG